MTDAEIIDALAPVMADEVDPALASHGGGGGSFGGGGKVGKSAKNVKARKAYKSASSKVRKANRDLKIADRKSSAAQGALTKAGKASHAARKAGTYNNKKATKYMNAADKALGASLARNAAARKIGGSKSGLTRVTNRLTGKGVAKAKRGAVNPNKLASSKKYATARKARKGSAVRKDAVASAKIKGGERRVRAAAKKNKSEIKMTRRQYSKVHKDFKGSDPKNPRALKFVEGNAMQLSFEDESFDVIYNVESSHCYSNMPQFISEAYRILRPGGYFAWTDFRDSKSMKSIHQSFISTGFDPTLTLTPILSDLKLVDVVTPLTSKPSLNVDIPAEST